MLEKIWEVVQENVRGRGRGPGEKKIKRPFFRQKKAIAQKNKTKQEFSEFIRAAFH